jgi:hypothetical protein
MNSLQKFWQRITSTRYTHALETEVARLRAENRALLNSILGIAGVPPLPVFVAPSVVDSAPPVEAAPIVGEPAMPATQAGAKQSANVPVPMRRRSWHQINRMLEFESAKKKDSIDPA